MTREFVNLILGIIRLLFRGLLGSKPSEGERIVPLPDNDTTTVRTGVRDPDRRAYMTPAMIALLALIREHESGKAGYNADYRNNNKWKLTNKTFSDVRALGRQQVTHGKEKSSAIGGYQFLTKTLDSLKLSLGLTGNERFSESLQDDLAVALMIRRGKADLSAGVVDGKFIVRDVTAFANQLAREWASLPVVTPIKGAHRQLKVGQSYYAGDGLNKAFHKPETVIAALRAIQQERN